MEHVGSLTLVSLIASVLAINTGKAGKPCRWPHTQSNWTWVLARSFGWKLSRLVLQRRQNNFAHWSTQTFYLNAIKIYLLLACKVNQNGVLLVSLLIVYMSHIEYIHWTWFDQEALGANVALEDINRTALVRLKQVEFNLIFYFFHKVIIRAWKNLARASHTKFPPRTQRRTLRTAAWVLLTGLRCRNDQYFCTNGHWLDVTLL